MEKYITQLTNDEIEAFFLMNGYKLHNDLKTKHRENVKSIERSDQIIFVRAKKIEQESIDIQLAYQLSKHHPGFMSLHTLSSLNEGFCRNIDFIHFSDFHMAKSCIYPEDKKESDMLCRSYIDYMSKKFPTYQTDYNNYIKSLHYETEQENLL